MSRVINESDWRLFRKLEPDIDSCGVPMGHVQWFTRSFFWMRGVISGLLKESKKGRERGRRVW